MNRKLTAVLLIAAAVLTNAAFTGLGSVFNYPDVLKEPADDILAAFRDSQARSAAGSRSSPCPPPCSRRSPSASAGCPTHRAMRIAVPVGIAAAVVQVIGLSRWPLLVPGYAADAASTDPGTAARGPRLLRHRAPGPRQPDRRDLRLPAHRGLDPARPRRPAPVVRRPLVHRARRRSSAVLVLAGVLSPLDLPRHRHRQLRRLRPVERVARRLRRPAAGRAGARRDPAVEGRAGAARAAPMTSPPPH